MGQRIEKAGGRNEGIIYLLLAVFQLSIVSLALMQVAIMTIWTEVLEPAEVTKKKRGGILRAFLNV